MWSFLLLASVALAPHDAGTITGTIRDPAGTAIAGVVVTLDGRRDRVVSDGAGRYLLTGLPAGRWTLRATRTGYRPLEVAGVELRRGERLERNLVLVPTRPERDIAAEAKDERLRHQLNAPASKAQLQANGTGMTGWAPPPFNTEDYRHFADNRFLTVGANPLSTFAIDVDAASYANVRRFLTQGQLPPADAVRSEELINYFPYDYPAPRGEHPFSITTGAMAAPWKPAHRLVLVGLQGRRIDAARLPPANLVFLLDVSGSMSSPDKLPLVKRAFRLLVEQLRPQDHVAIVVYAGAAGLVLPSTPGSDKEAILAAIERLEAGGSTAGGEGIKLAYDVAREHHRQGGNNRVILATDGDFNVGVSSEGELVRLIDERKRQGTFLTVLGFGTGNLKDSRMEALADKGNGHYAYIDDIMEARKVLVQELGATLTTIAQDVKVQVEFNPRHVAAYRLIGYENRLLAAEDFNDDAKDGGELGAGHSVTALYEVVPVGQPVPGAVDELRYQGRGQPPREARDDELLTVKLRYQPPGGGASRLVQATVRRDERERPEALSFAAAVAEFGMLLRNSEHKGAASWEQALQLARGAQSFDPGGYRAEFVRLLEVARDLGGARGQVGLRE